MAEPWGATHVEGGGREHHRPVARERGQDSDEGLGDALPARAVARIAHQPLHGGLAHARQKVAQGRHRVALRPRSGVRSGRLEQRIHRLPPERAVGQAEPGGRDRRVHFAVAAFGVGVGLGARLSVRAQRIGARERRTDELAHAGGRSGRACRRHHQAQQVRQERALGRERGQAPESPGAGRRCWSTVGSPQVDARREWTSRGAGSPGPAGGAHLFTK